MTIFTESITDTVVLTPSVVNTSTIDKRTVASVAEGDSYMLNRLDASAWTSATAAKKLTALIDATLRIEQLNYRGTKAVATQQFQMPRDDDTVIPVEYKYACIELAYSLLDGVDAQIEYENMSMASHTYGNVKTVYDTTFPPEHIAAGIPSVLAWRFLKPFLRDWTTIDLRRVN